MSPSSLGDDPLGLPNDPPELALRWPPDGHTEPGHHLDTTVPPLLSGRELTADDFEAVRRRRVVLPIFLFVATCLSTFFVVRCIGTRC